MLIEASIALMNFLTCCTDLQFQSSDISIIIDFVFVELLQKIDVLIQLRGGTRLFELILEMLGRLFHLVQTCQIDSFYGLTESVFDIIDSLDGLDKIN